MPKYVQVFGRLGNKTTDLKFFKHLVGTEYEIIVEPFCGSCAFSLNLFPDCEKYDYHFNDLDEDLFILLNNINEYLEFEKRIHEQFEEFRKENHEHFSHTWLNTVKNIDSKFTKIFVNKYFIRGSLFKHKTNFNVNPNHINIFDKATKTNVNYKQVMEMYKDNDKALLFLDPPYLFSNNSSYIPQADDTDSTDIIIYILEYLRVCKCHVILIINDLKILRYLFKDFIKSDYTRVYQLTSKKMKHIVITNY